VSWTEADRRHLAELYAEQDRMMAEFREEQRSRAEDTLVYKTHENVEVTAPESSSDESVALFGDGGDETLSEAIGMVIAHERQRERTELGEAIAPLKREIAERVTENAKLREEVAELRGKLDAVLMMLSRSSAAPEKSGEVVDLPRGFWKRSDAA